MAKYLDYDGLGKVWAKIDLLFARKTQLASVYKVKGSCTTANLPTNAVEGDVWNLTDAGTYGPAGTNVVWVAATGSETTGHWDSLGAPIQTATTSNDGLMTAAMVTKLNGIATGANNYTHPSYTAQTSGLYKITVDATGHVSAATAVAKADITGLGIPGSDTNTTYTFTNGTNGFTVTPSGGTAQTVTVTPSITNNALTTSTVSGTVTGSTTGTAGVGGTVGAPTVTITKATVTNALGYTPPTTNTTYSDFTGASSSAAGTHGLVPAPAAGANTKFLRGDGTWQSPTFTIPNGSADTIGGVKTGAELSNITGYTAVGIKDNVIYYKDTTYNAATTSAAGLMSAADKSKLDGIASQANKYTLPKATSTALGGVMVGATIEDTTGYTAVKVDGSGKIYYQDTNTTYGAEKGITLTSGKFGHSNTAVTAVTTAGLYKVKYDAYGHITGTTAVAKADITALGIPGSNTTYTAEKGITLADGKFGHSNTAITATSSASYLVKYDAYGHVTGSDQAVAITEAEINTICVQ